MIFAISSTTLNDSRAAVYNAIIPAHRKALRSQGSRQTGNIVDARENPPASVTVGGRRVNPRLQAIFDKQGGISFASDLKKFGRIRTVADEEAQPGGSGLSF